MLDAKLIRESPKTVKQALLKRGVDFDVDEFIRADDKRREVNMRLDAVRAKHNKTAEMISRVEGDDKKKMIQEAKGLKKKLLEIESLMRNLDMNFVEIISRLPNLPLEHVPYGRDESNNVILREAGKKPIFSFPPRDYMELAETLDLIDTKRAAKVSGSRFGYLKREAVLLELAMLQFGMQKLVSYGFIPIIPPVLVRGEMMKGMGYIDSEKDRDERYFLERDKLFLVGTSEQSLGPMHAEETFLESELPARYAGFSSCFRREAGSYGKDTRGILRVHQFDKLEMFSYTTPENSGEEHKKLLAIEEELVSDLGLPYQVVALCAGDLSSPSAATYDINTWMPGQNNGQGQYRETHSTSNTTDFQARRLGIRYKTKASKGRARARFVHMLNGTAIAFGRLIIAILENYQQKDGSVLVPEALRPFMNNIEAIKR